MSGTGTAFGIQLHGTFPMPMYAELARAVEIREADDRKQLEGDLATL